jgi:hypothetical protein
LWKVGLPNVECEVRLIGCVLGNKPCDLPFCSRICGQSVGIGVFPREARELIRVSEEKLSQTIEVAMYVALQLALAVSPLDYFIGCC